MSAQFRRSKLSLFPEIPEKGGKGLLKEFVFFNGQILDFGWEMREQFPESRGGGGSQAAHR